MGEPYVQLLSLVDITQAAADFQQLRGGTVNVQETNGNPSPSVSVEDSPDRLDKLVSMIPILLAIAGTNGVILLILLVGAVWFCCLLKRNKTKKVAPLPLAMINAATHHYEAVSTAEDAQERPSSARFSRPTSKQSLHSLSDINGLPHSPLKAQGDTALRRSRYSLKPRASEGDGSKRSSHISLSHKPPSPSPSIGNGFVSAESQLVDEPEQLTEDITDRTNKPVRPVPPPPITVPGYRRSTYSENAASPTVACSEQGVQLYDVPVRSSMAVSNASPSPTASQFEDARGSMYAVTSPPESNSGVNNVSVPPGITRPPLPPSRMHLQSRSQQQEAQRAAFMAALDNEPLPPPRRPHGFGSRAQAEDPRQRLSAYSAAPVVSQDMGLLVPSQINRHSYAAPTLPSGASAPQRSSYVPGSGPPRRSPFSSTPVLTVTEPVDLSRR